MDKDLVTFGPWFKGINFKNDAQTLTMNELFIGTNIEIDDVGTIKLRRPFRTEVEGVTSLPYLVGTMPLLDDNADKNVGTGVFYCLDNTINMMYPNKYVFGDGNALLLHTFDTAMPDVAGVFVYAGKFWILSKQTGSRNSWYSTNLNMPIDPGGPVAWPGPHPYDKVNGIGGGGMWADCYAIYLDRLFIALDDTVYFSKAGDFTKWNKADGGGFFVVGNASRDRINFMHVMYNMLYIFTSYETFSYTYGTDPNVDSSLQPVSKHGANIAVFYKDRLYCVSDDGLYQFVHNIYYPIDANIDVKWYSVQGIQGIEDNLIFYATLPDRKILVMRLDTGNPALVEWVLDLQTISPTDIYFGVEKTTQPTIMSINDSTQSYLMFKHGNTLKSIPTIYDLITYVEFYDTATSSASPGPIYYSSYEARIALARFDNKRYTQFKRIYYCNLDMTALGFYDGFVKLGDVRFVNDIQHVGRSDKFIKINFQAMWLPIKKKYPMDRARAIQPYIYFRPSDYMGVVVQDHERLPIKFELRGFQVVMNQMDVQQGEWR